MTTITVAGERLTAAQQQILTYPLWPTRPGRGRGLMFWRMWNRGLLERADESGPATYRLTVHGKVIADAIEAYRRRESGK